MCSFAAQEWCIARGYELVEINPEKDEEWEEEQDFLETTGIPRIVQALHAHVWPELNMKGMANPWKKIKISLTHSLHLH